MSTPYQYGTSRDPRPLDPFTEDDERHARNIVRIAEERATIILETAQKRAAQIIRNARVQGEAEANLCREKATQQGLIRADEILHQRDRERRADAERRAAAAERAAYQRLKDAA